MTRAIILCALTQAAFARADETPPPEIKKTVEALAGKWATEMTLTMPAQPPVKFKTTMDCRRIADGAAVQCSLRANVPGMGILDETDIWAWEPESRVLHDITINSWGEVHDHKGKWKDEHTAEFAHTATQAGKALEERETVTFHPPNQMEFTLTAKTPDGTTTFVGKARR